MYQEEIFSHEEYEQIHLFMKKPELTDSEIQLAILKLLSENNGILKAILKSMADIQSSMQVVDLPEDALESMRESYAEASENMAETYSKIGAVGFARKKLL